MKSNFKIGIIGGNGEMGKSLRKFFNCYKVDVIFSDINTNISNIDVVKNSDIIILAIPLENYFKVLNEIKDFLNEKKLLMDIGSLKEKQIKLMQNYHSGEILGTHPLFGPEKKFKAKENTIIICRVKYGDKSKFIIDLFEKNNLNVVELSPSEHDKIMAYIHGFYYLINITYLDILKDNFYNIENLKNLMTTSFNKYIESLENIFNTKDWLIDSISYKNPYINETVSKFKEKLGKRINIPEIREFLNER